MIAVGRLVLLLVGLLAPALLAGCAAYRGYATPAEIKASKVPAYGIVALEEGPTPTTKDRLLALCQAFNASSTNAALASGTVSFVTYWPVSDSRLVRQDADGCDSLTQAYRVDEGQRAIDDARKAGHDLKGRGPFLIAWSPGSARAAGTARVLTVDLSGVNNVDGFTAIFRKWREFTAQPADKWSDHSTPFWLALRQTVQQYSDVLKDLIKVT